MCKLFGIVEIENQRNAELFAKRAIPFITKTDNHGLGIMRLGENGVHVQRWLEPPTVIRKKKSKELAKYSKALKHQENEEGKPSKYLTALAIHGRFATCARSLENTHPFYKDGAALMHNGIISNADKFERTLSTCDSEVLLSQYLAHKVKADRNKLSNALDGVVGYYASVVFNDDGVIDIWRDNAASLFLAHVRHVGVVFATTSEIIMQTAKKCKAYVTGIDEILSFTTIRWQNGVNPSISTFVGIKPSPALPSAFGGSIIEHQNSVSDANAFDSEFPKHMSDDEYTQHWWDIENDKDREAARVADWQADEDTLEKRTLQNLYDQKRGR